MILDGRALSRTIRGELKDKVAMLTQALGRPPRLSVVLVGEDPASMVYVRNKERAARSCAIDSETLRLPGDTSEASILEHVRSLDRDESVDGILVQLPLPKHISKGKIIDEIHPDKDVDGFHALNIGAVAIGHPRMPPCTAMAVLRLIQHSGVELDGAEAVIVGTSMIAGLPAALLLSSAGATVTCTNIHTRDLKAHVQRGEILVAAAGVPELVKGDWVREGAVVIDVGITRQGDKLVGDVEYEPALERAAAITPVPGGVGPMTITMLLANTVHAAHRRAQKLGLIPGVPSSRHYDA